MNGGGVTPVQKRKAYFRVASEIGYLNTIAVDDSGRLITNVSTGDIIIHDFDVDEEKCITYTEAGISESNYNSLKTAWGVSDAVIDLTTSAFTLPASSSKASQTYELVNNLYSPAMDFWS